MVELFSSGRVADVILAVMVIEAIVLGGRALRGAKGPGLIEILANLASGACLVLALRMALTGEPPQVIGLFLMGSFAAHLVDLWYRLRRP
ncbi:MAG: hypothetical protein NW217_04815 [Hyphomicrobiaceae bacterium]|nr:hypothetical protein [Hyphomicrobiaceae bacterium]